MGKILQGISHLLTGDNPNQPVVPPTVAPYGTPPIALDPRLSEQLSPEAQQGLNAVNTTNYSQPAGYDPSYTPPAAYQKPHGFAGLLSTIGDAISVGSGGVPYGKTHQEQAFIGDAIQHMDDPRAMGVIARYNPQLAEQIQQTKAMMNYRAAALGIRRDDTDSKIGARTANAAPKVLDSVTRLAGTADANSWPTIRDYIKNTMDRNGMDSSTVPDQYDPQSVNDWISTMGQSYVQDRRQTETERNNKIKNDIGKQNADSNRIKAGASAQQAATSASIAPSTIQRNNAQAGYNEANTDYIYGNNTPNFRGGKPVRTPRNAAPPSPGMLPPRHVGDHIRGPNGQVLTSHDGKTWSQ